ncbi:MAG TPA: hypothetical protein VF221_20275, partial [Chloroflexota bacterium]
LLERIPSLPIERWPALGTALSDAVARRDIMLYDRRPQVQPAIVDSGADGHFLPAPGDYLAVVDDNRSYNKINPYVREAASYRVAIRPDLWLDATLRIRYHVAPSPADLHGAGPAFGLQGTKHDYEDFLRVYVPAGAQLVQMSGLDRWAPAPAYGLTQFAGRLLVREGQTRTVTLRYRIPANALSQAPSGRYVLTVRHQPGGNLTSLQTSIVGRNGVILSAPQGVAPDVTRILHLDRDARMDLSLQGTQRPRVVQLPRSAGPVDPYIPFSDFHDPRHPL